MKLARRPARNRRWTAAISAVLLVGVSTLNAQEPEAAPNDSVPLYRIEGITVTVSRSRENVNRLPYAVGLLTAPEIRALEPTISLSESLAEIPGVLVDNRHNFALGNRISVRGFGARSQFGVRGIRIIQDGIPLTLPDGQAQLNNIDLAAAGRIEVIRGPAASLYGNASAGVISIQTAEPPPSAFQSTVRAVGGGFGDDRRYGKVDLTGAGTLGEVGYTGHLSYFDTEGFRVHSEAERALFNARLLYRIDDASELTGILNYSSVPQAENPSTLNDSLAAANPDTVRDIVLPAAECPPAPGFGGCQNLGEESRQLQGGLIYRRRLTDLHGISLMAYGVSRRLDNRIPFRLIELDRRGGGGRAEYRFAPVGGRLRGLVAGFDVDHQADDRLETARGDERSEAVTLDQDERVTALGVFGNAMFDLGLGLEASLSLRYDRVRFAAEDHLVLPDDPDDSGTRTMDQWSPMLGLSWRSSSALNFYANLGRTFQTPTTTELTDTLGGFNADLEPERALHFELGAKGTLAERLSYSLALFHAEIEGQLIGFETEELQRIFFRNAGSSDHDGLELGISALLLPGLTATAAYTFSDFEFESFATPGGSFGGNEVPGVPPHHLHGRLNYAYPSGLSGSLRVTAGDGYFVDNANSSRNAGYVTVDLRVGLRARLRGLGIEPFIGVNNVFDERYNSSVVVNAFGGRFFEPAPGRNSYVGIRLRP